MFPRDLDAFYNVCSSVKLFFSRDYVMDKFSLDRFVLSNPLILPEGWEQDVPGHESSDDWYIIEKSEPK